MSLRPVFITGASGNIGEAIAHRLLRDGRPLALTHSPRGKPLASLPPSDSVRWYDLEVCDSASMTQTIARVQADFGVAPDLVYCAGVTGDHAIPRVSDDEWRRVIDTNLSGAFYALRALSMGLMMAGDGRIVLIGSVSGSKGTAGQVSYAATKGGLEAMARVVAVELGRTQVTCNVVSPGLIEGRMVDEIPEQLRSRVVKNSPLRQMGKPEDVAGVVSMLLGPDGRYITGQTIQVDGGLTAM